MVSKAQLEEVVRDSIANYERWKIAQGKVDRYEKVFKDLFTIFEDLGLLAYYDQNE